MKQFHILVPCKGLDNERFERRIVSYFSTVGLNVCFGCSYFLVPQHMFWLRNKKIQF